ISGDIHPGAGFAIYRYQRPIDRKGVNVAIPKTFAIDFSCGHTETKDLSDTPAGKRRGKVFWLGKNYVCSKCFKAKGKAELEKQNKQQLVDAQSFEEEQIGRASCRERE